MVFRTKLATVADSTGEGVKCTHAYVHCTLTLDAATLLLLLLLVCFLLRLYLAPFTAVIIIGGRWRFMHAHNTRNCAAGAGGEKRSSKS